MPKRPLSLSEIAEVRQVFGNGLDYARARVFENTPLPDLIADLGRSPKPNAITLGNVSYFPVTLQTSAETIARRDFNHISWLIHELTHQWQFQRMGWSYLLRAVWVQIRERSKAYDYQGTAPSREAALRAALAAGRRLADFNPEQQGDLARHYYLALNQSPDAQQAGDPTAWEPFVAEFQRRAYP